MLHLRPLVRSESGISSSAVLLRTPFSTRLPISALLPRPIYTPVRHFEGQSKQIPLTRPESVAVSHWESVARHRQVRLWHVARIENEGLGKEAAVPCKACSHSGNSCWVYEDEAHSKAFGATCSRCRNLHVQCSHNESKGVHDSIRLSEKVIELREEVEKLKGQVKQLKKDR